MNAEYSRSVWPQPQQSKWGKGALDVAKGIHVVPSGETPFAAKAARSAEAVLNSRAPKRIASSRKSGGVTLKIGGMDILPKGLCQAVRKDEGYILAIQSDEILLCGADEAGAFYGAQTLAQLLETGSYRELPQAVIRDWPRFPFRGAHLYMPARENLDFFHRFLEFLARYKYNKIILEVGGGMEYERRPEINEAWRKYCHDADNYEPTEDSGCERFKQRHPRGANAMSNSRHYWKDSTHTELGGGDCLTKDEVRSILAACAERHIEVIPEVQSLSHSYYLCCAYPEIAERSDDPWPDTYCVANPESYEVLFDVMEEVIEVFQPKVMHVGHDELYHIASCPRCRDRSGHELLAEDLNRIHDFLAERGVRMFMWSDKLMRFQGKGEEEQGGVYYEEFDPGSGKTFVINPTYKAADMVPGDILICDWYWGLDPKSEHYFHDHGFEMIFGNFSPLGFSDWESRSRVPWVLGAEISSWCAVEPWAFGHNGTAHAFHPGADMLWNGRQLPRGEVTRRMARAMSIETDRLTGEPRRLVSGRGKADPIDISGAATPLAAAPTAPAKSLSGQIKAPASATTVLGTGRFDLITDERGLLARGIVIGKSNPRSKPVPVGRRAKAIQVMHGSTMAGVFMQPSFYMYHRGPAEVLRYRVRYSDGGEESFSSFFGEDIGPANGEWPTKPGGICYRAVPVDFGDHTFFAQEWENPRPDASISEIVVEVGADAVEIGDITVAAISLIK